MVPLDWAAKRRLGVERFQLYGFRSPGLPRLEDQKLNLRPV
jgi:hypothetical protein